MVLSLIKDAIVSAEKSDTEKIKFSKDIQKQLFVDLHIHSRFSRATSKNLSIVNLVKYARIKGIDLLGTGDISHEKWLLEIKEKLVEKDNSGIYWYADEKGEFPFILSGEISLVFTKNGKGRRVHLVYLVPNLEVNSKINNFLDSLGRRDYDGRPIFNISCEDFVRKLMEISDKIEVIPAHCLLGHTKIHTKTGLKSIKDIQEKDFVYTHKNKWQKVNEKIINDYSGELYHIRPWYFSEGLKATSDHPFYAIKSYKCNWINGLCKKNCSKLNECKNKRFEKYFAEWVFASELRVGDFLVYPRFNGISSLSSFKEIKITEGLCKLIGYYLAEGYLIRNEGIGFSFSKKEDSYIEEVKSLISTIFNKSEFKIDERKGKDIIFYSQVLNRFFSEFYNSKSRRRADTKALNSIFLELPLHYQIEIFRGWFAGDAGYTVSQELMNQMKMLCLRMGIIPNIHIDTPLKYERRGKHIFEGRIIKSNFNLYSFSHLSFFEDKFNLLHEELFKKFKSKLNRKHGWIDENYVYLPIRKIEKESFSGEVYNLEVEEDNSYVAEFACVHNCWTPWFGVFGSKSGFDSLKDAFGEQEKNIHAIETGMSSDPEMNWKIKELENRAIVSFSDLHSFWPWRLGREATIFSGDNELTYLELILQIRNRTYIGTIETDPGY
ncbi:MAG: hypothetical protein Q8L27_01930, partial [archaeon]|nr:hypothetical protein [archaeon]